MNKVVINERYGGFGLSVQAAKLLIELGMEGIEVEDGYVHCDYNLCRHDPRLVEVVEKLGIHAGGRLDALVVKTIPGNRYRIIERDGWESVECPEEMKDLWTVIDKAS